MDELMKWLSYAPEALAAVLMMLGGLKIMAKYTKWQWDDKAVDAADKAVRWALNLAKKLKPAKKEDKDAGASQ